jgi:hypothetical protein
MESVDALVIGTAQRKPQTRTLPRDVYPLFSSAVRDISQFPMYAIRGGSHTYHLVNTRTGLTICGLRPLPVRIRRKNGTSLSHTPTRPLDSILCKHCLRLSAPDHQVTA